VDIRLIEGRYKSISTLDWRGIPKFALITGANGSGKTQLLELIARSASVFPSPPGAYNPRGLGQETFDAKVVCSERLDAQNTVMLRSHWDVSDAHASVQQVHEMATEAWNAGRVPDGPARTLLWEPLWNTLERTTGLHRSDIDRDLFDETLPPNFILMKDGATNPASMSSSIPLLFVSYASRIFHLEQERVSPHDVAAKLGVFPWVAVNEVLIQAGLQYEMVAPVAPKASWTQAFHPTYRLELRHLRTGVCISPSALSSGERVVFLTAIWSYFFSQSALQSKAALLLLDEPDAHLHPALTSLFLRVIRRELVERRGIRVIATTHSPSTVALAEEGELFVMGHDEPRIRPELDKWKAVAHLTAGLVTVGTHTKAVFVEDRSDADFFRTVQAIMLRGTGGYGGFDAARSLNFIPASTGRQGGGKQMVIQWVRAIETTQVAGIIDRDEDPEPDDRVHAGSRRNLESYLLDPLFIYALLLDENTASRPVLAPEVDHQHSKLVPSLPVATMQRIVDGMAEIYAQLIQAGPQDELVETRYLGGAKVQIPAWLLRCDMKQMIEPLRQKLGVSWTPDYLIRKYEVLGVVPAEIAEMLTRIQRA
jgi:predicted ATPase